MEDFVYHCLTARIAAIRYMAEEPIRHDVKSWRKAELLSETNTLERPFNWKLRLRPKHIELMEDLLIWRPNEEQVPVTQPQPSDIGLLNKFVSLCRNNTTREDILKFAREWGVLGICQHFQPFPHYRRDIDLPVHILISPQIDTMSL